MRWSNFTWLVKKGVDSVWHNRMMSFASFCVLLVSLLMVGLAALAALNINLILSYVEDQNELLVFTDGELTEFETNEISTIIRNSEYVKNGGVSFRSREETWIEYKNQYPEANVIYEKIEYNPMPNTFVVTINDLTKISAAAEEFRKIEGAYKVTAPHDFAEFLISMRTTLTIIGGTVILALIAICLVIIYNSSRASVFARRQEINIMKYVGATNAFVKIPFFIEGMFVGVLAGGASWILTKISYESICKMFSQDVTLWEALGLANLIEFSGISWAVLAANCVVGAILSAAGIIMSMGKHLKV